MAKLRKKSRIIRFIAALAVSCLLLAGCQDAGESSKADESTPVPTERTDASAAETAREENGTGFRVGFSRISIMPEDSVPLGGYGNTSRRMSNGSMDNIYVQCVFITDENDDSLILMFYDAIRVGSWLSSTRAQVSRATGVPEDRIYCAASHSHSTPDTANTAESSILRYLMDLPVIGANAAREAMEDRAPATMSVGSTEVEKMNFVRHYLLSNGTYAGDNYGDFSSGTVVGHETEADHLMRILVFEREEKQDILLANWQCHPTFLDFGSLDVSSDFVGYFRKGVEKEIDAYCVYWQGAAGNINPRSKIQEETPTRDLKEFGEKLSAYAVDVYRNGLQAVESGPIKTAKEIYKAEADHSEDEKVNGATIVNDIWVRTNDRTAAAEEGKKYGIHSAYHAGAILTKRSRGATVDVELNAAVIGGIAFATFPGEMFDVTGIYIREQSAAAMTFIMGYCNGNVSYMPADYAYDNTCYEADVSPFAKGTAEKVAVRLSEMISALGR